MIAEILNGWVMPTLRDVLNGFPLAISPSRWLLDIQDDPKIQS